MPNGMYGGVRGGLNSPYSIISNNLYMIPALVTLCRIWTAYADSTTTLIFTISITVGCTIGQYLIVWTDIAIVILIIHVPIFFEEPFLGHGTPVWQERPDSIIKQKFCYTGCFIKTKEPSISYIYFDA